MAITIKDCKAINCGTGISVPNNMLADLDIDGFEGVDCGKVLEVRDDARFPQTSLLGALGLTENTPPEILRELLTYLKEHSPSRWKRLNWKREGCGCRTI